MQSATILKAVLAILASNCGHAQGQNWQTEGVWNYEEIPAQGDWTTWEAWTSCTATCGGGNQQRNRACITKYSFEVCLGGEIGSQACNTNGCPVDGAWSAWEDWQECNNPCGGGTRQRIKTCTNPAPAFGGTSCSGISSDSESCNDHPCPIDGNWGIWGAWSSCPVGCGPLGNLTRSRSCNNPAPQHGGNACTGNNEDATECDPCPIHGVWSDWTPWTACSTGIGCGSGTHSRDRACDNPAPEHGGNTCPGNSADSKACVVCPVDGAWTAWGAWEACDIGCGTSGLHPRTRTCTNPAPVNGGLDCAGSDTDTKACDPCPIHGGWSAWEGWTACNTSCVYTRNRTCDNPVPEHGGNDCPGLYYETSPCSPCPVDGNWTEWTTWSDCPAPVVCGPDGNRTRSRTCTNPAPANGGLPCTGDGDGVKECNPCSLDHTTFQNTAQNFLDTTTHRPPPGAVDGDWNTFWHSGEAINEWFQCDLIEAVEVHRVLMFGRLPSTGTPFRMFGYQARIGLQETVAGDHVITWNTPCGDPVPGTESDFNKFYLPRNWVFTCSTPIYGRYVTIQRELAFQEHSEVGELYVLTQNMPPALSLEHKLICFDYVEYRGAGLGQPITTDIWACRDICTAASGCIAYTFDTGTGRCKKLGTVTHMVYNSVRWSGTLDGDGCLYN